MTYIQLLTWLRNNNWHQVEFTYANVQLFRRLGDKKKIGLTPFFAGVFQNSKNPNNKLTAVQIPRCFIRKGALHIGKHTFRPQE